MLYYVLYYIILPVRTLPQLTRSRTVMATLGDALGD